MKKILSFAVISLLVFSALQLGLATYLEWRVASGHWIESVASKSELLKQRHDVKFILLGTSTTQNHFNTLWMSEHGLESFNYGLPGRYWEDFPSILHRFESSKATDVVLNLPVRAFLHPVSCPAFRTLYDFAFFYQLKGFACVHKFNLRHLFPLYSDWPFMGNVFKPSKEYYESVLLHYGTDLELDPRQINYARGNEKRSVITFENGDGAVFADSVRKSPSSRLQMRMVDKSSQALHPEALKFLSLLAAEIQRQGKRLTVVLEPRMANETILINTAQLRSALGPQVNLITNHAWSIPSHHWADFMHLKPVAAQFYTELVTCQLKHAGMHPSCQSSLEKLTSVLP